MNRTLLLITNIGFILLQVGCKTKINSTDLELIKTDKPIPDLSSTQMIKTQINVTVTTTYTPIPTILPPTLPVETAQALIAKLLKTNVDCRLPCWWGIKPGQADWTVASQTMDQLGKGKPSSSGWWYYFPNLENQTYLNIHFIVSVRIIKMIEITFGNTYYLPLSELLTEYGSPSEIFIRTFSNDYQGVIPFYILLFYEDQGILARYESNEARIVAKKNVQICFNRDPMWGVVLWDPNNRQTYLEVIETANTVGIGGLDDQLPLKSIEEAANMSPNYFFKTYKYNTDNYCLETPADLWPGQFE